MPSVLYDLLRLSAPTIHTTRLKALLAAVVSLTMGAQATITSLGRGLAGPAFINIKSNVSIDYFPILIFIKSAMPFITR